MSKFSENLIYLRKRNGLTQADLAKALGISRGAICMYETGKRVPRLEDMEAIADYFNIDLNTLTGNEDPITNLPSIKRDFIARVKAMDEEQVVRLDKMLDLWLEGKQ